jgi:Zn-dependent M28 family amino/carboxypeptidase
MADKLASAYAELPSNANARSILLLTFSAEESGLIGSHYYVNHPSLSLDKIDLMLNMDMIGRLREKNGLEVQGTESASGLYDWLVPYFNASKLKIAHGSEVAGNSDHASFYQKKLPVLFFFTGLHREYPHTQQIRDSPSTRLARAA